MAENSNTGFLKGLKIILGSTTGVASLYCEFLHKIWPAIPFSFVISDTSTTFICTRSRKVILFQFFEALTIALFGIVLCPYAIYRQKQPSKINISDPRVLRTAIYKEVTFVHTTFYFMIIATPYPMLRMALDLFQGSHYLQISFNALSSLRKRIISTTHTDLHGSYILKYTTRQEFYVFFAQNLLPVIVMPPIVAIVGTFVKLDPLYFVFREIFLENFDNVVTFCITYVFRFLVVFIYVTAVVCRFIFFNLLLDCCRNEAYDFVLTTFLQSKPSPNSHRLYIQLYMIHQILGKYFQSFYCTFLGLGQISVVFFLYVSIMFPKKMPFIIWQCFPQLAFHTSVQILIFFGMCLRAHSLSADFINRMTHESVKMSKYQRKLWTAVKPIDMRCGGYFVISGGTLLVYMHVVLNNLATVILLHLDE